MKYHADRLSTANADVHKIMALVHALREKAISTDYGTSGLPVYKNFFRTQSKFRMLIWTFSN